MTLSGLPRDDVSDADEILLAEIRKLIFQRHPESQFIIAIYSPGGPTGMRALCQIEMSEGRLHSALEEMSRAVDDKTLYHRSGKPS